MTDRESIITAYEAKEAEVGGVAHCDVRRIAEMVAEDLGVPYETVREVMTEHWAGAAN